MGGLFESHSCTLVAAVVVVVVVVLVAVGVEHHQCIHLPDYKAADTMMWEGLRDQG